MTQLSYQTREFLKSDTGQMVLGLVLGDGTLTSSGRFEHSQRGFYAQYSKHISCQFQKEFPELLTPKIKAEYFYIRQRINSESLVTYISQTFYTKTHDIWRELYIVFYPRGQKIIPLQLIKEFFTIKSLLYLYLDDGRVGRRAHSGLGFDLCNFTITELNLFQSFLLQEYQLDTTIHKEKQYPVIYVKMESSKQLLSRFLQLTNIVESIGIIGETKLQFKPINRVFASAEPTYQLQPVNEKTILIGVLQGLIVGGANFRWNKNRKTAYLRFTVKKVDTAFLNSIVSSLKDLEYKQKEPLNGKSIQIGVSINQVLSQHLQEIVDQQNNIQNISQQPYLKNPWFWQTLFLYKGRDLSDQRAGLTIGCNHLLIEQVDQLSKFLNDSYNFETVLRYRDKKTKASIYIPVKNREKFLEFIHLNN